MRVFIPTTDPAKVRKLFSNQKIFLYCYVFSKNYVAGYVVLDHPVPNMHTYLLPGDFIIY